MKRCEDCVHFMRSDGMSETNNIRYGQCRKWPRPDPISVKFDRYMYCENARERGAYCGPNGKHWQAADGSPPPPPKRSIWQRLFGG